VVKYFIQEVFLHLPPLLTWLMNARAISERLHKRYSSSSVGNFDADLQSNKINTTTRFFPGPNDDKLEIKIKQTASDL
jgi:hypothetical protein